MLSPEHFLDIDAKRVFDNLKHNRPVVSLPFESPPVDIADLEKAAEEIRRSKWLRDVLLFGTTLTRAASTNDVKKVETLMQHPPRLDGQVEQADPTALNLALIKKLMVPGSLSVKPSNPSLKPLGFSFYPNSITVFTGLPGGGKSAMVQRLALDLTSQGIPFLDLSLEDSQEFRHMRYLQALGGPSLSPARFAAGQYDPVTLKTAMEHLEWVIDPFSGTRTKRPFRIEAESRNLPAIKVAVEDFMEFYKTFVHEQTSAGKPHPGPPVVAVDFIQLVTVPGATTIYDKINTVMEYLYEITRTHGIALLLVSQLKRTKDEEHKEFVPSMQLLEGSPRLEQLAHNIIFFYTPKPAWSKGAWRKVICEAVKFRTGDLFKMDGMFNGGWLNFTFDPAEMSSYV